MGAYFTTSAGDVDFSRMFLIPSGTALVGAILLALFFHPPATAGPTDGKG
ncbi:MAG: hypothetical protein L0211_05465 [Planctomycetaceae bacterium]|nr:hypothetical protein [Planctomycetaceae bacterium]